MINMRENSSFDVEGTKKKIRNFLRQEISKRPELVKRWNEVMEGDVDSYDDYGELTYIESIFKNYKDNHKIEYEPDTNTFNFFIPLNCKRIDEYRDWSIRDAIAEEMQEEGKKYFGTEAFECPEGFIKGKYMSKEKLLEMKKKNSEAHKGKPSKNKGSKRPGMRWYTNGKINMRAKECPEGFWPGRVI